MTFGTILKNGTFQFITAVDSFWATIGKIGLLLISTSGHTGHQCSLGPTPRATACKSPSYSDRSTCLRWINQVPTLFVLVLMNFCCCKNGPTPASFSFFSSFQIPIQFLQKIYVKNVCEVYSGVIEPTSFSMWVSSHNHQTKALALHFN